MKKHMAVLSLFLFISSCSNIAYKGNITLLITDNKQKKIQVQNGSHVFDIIKQDIYSFKQLKLGENTNTVFYIRETNKKYLIGKIAAYEKTDNKIVESDNAIFLFDLSGGSIFYTSATADNREPVLLVEYNQFYKKRNELIKIKDDKEYISSFAIVGNYIFYIISGFAKHDLYSYNMISKNSVFIKSAVANVFSSKEKLIIETMFIDKQPNEAIIKFNSSLVRYDADKFTDLGMKYERMGGFPIILDDNKLLIPIERNRLRNQIKSFPFGFQDKDISYVIYDYYGRGYWGTIIETNTNEKEVMDAKCF